ncbi:uncharacterized protein LOC118477115 [Aplysia californica]|uniref:Uncharacterized protein LOC118477115 n=1 Tax=Aplysia californica TaxID=6500 RepID=A0ABM0JN74_APLCA|nr:uncharacterized protein LOC118477115 [Aplysia californica]
MSSTLRTFPLILVAFTCSQSLEFEHAPRTDESPCDVTDDDVRGGEYVNCTARGLTSLEPNWFPENATTLSLDHNMLQNLVSGCFRHLSELQVLTISDSQVTTIHDDALRGLGKLKELNLENNNIYTRRLSRTLFSHVPNLENLYLKGNTWENEGTRESPSSSAVPFSNLSLLTRLSIDGDSEIYFGQPFFKLKNLTYLYVYCPHDVIKGSNRSFEGFRDVALRELVLESPTQEAYFETGIFANVQNLDILRIHDVAIGNQNIMKCLWPFENKGMVLIDLYRVNLRHHRASPKATCNDGLMTKESLKHLSNICLSQLIWDASKVVGIEPRALSVKPNLRKCLKSLRFTRNLIGKMDQWRSLILELIGFESLEELQWGALDWCGPGYDFKFRNVQNVRKSVKETNYIFDTKHTSVTLTHALPHYSNRNNGNSREILTIPSGNRSLLGTPSIRFPRERERTRFTRSSFFRCPKHLQSLIVVGLDGYLRIPACHIRDGHNVKEIRIVSCDFIEWSGHVTGLENVTLMDFTRSHVISHPNFVPFQNFPNLETLLLNAMSGSDFIDQLLKESWLEKTPKLQHIDLRDNHLHKLPSSVFSSNLRMNSILLSSNRLTSLGFDLSTTPSLGVLDLRKNAISSLDIASRTALDTHAQSKPDFSLLLEGNPIYCMCSRVPFLVWLHTTWVRLDMSGNYSCIDDRGQDRWTSDLITTKALWRRCVGKTFLLVSLSQALSLIVGFLAVYMWRRFRTAVWAFFLNILAPGFRKTKMEDCGIHVFVGYADDDFRFVRFVLRRYLEEDLSLTTYIHQRDLRAGYLDQQLLDAIQDSWRLVLVLSANFLRRYEKAHLVMKMCTSAVTPVNPDRVLVLVEQGQGRHVPDYVLAVLDEEKLVRLHSLNEELGYEQKQRIKHLILS